MSDYKNVRLEQSVYNELLKRQHPQESFSDEIERLLNYLDELAGHACAITEIIGEAHRAKKEVKGNASL
jgi:predicted CopG family antitoxin